MRKIIIKTFLNMTLCFFVLVMNSYAAAGLDSLPKGWVYLHNVDNSIDQKIEFSTNDNCVGAILDGYEGNQVVCTLELARALQKVQQDLKRINKNYSLQILDAYRPVRASKHILRWAQDEKDIKTKAKWYPDIDKKELPGKYIAASKSAHNRGSTVDLVIIDKRTGEWLDYGQYSFGNYAHINYSKLTPEQRKNRNMLRSIMLKHDFRPYDQEFWHFTLNNEPFPNTYFDFIIRNERQYLE